MGKLSFSEVDKSQAENIAPSWSVLSCEKKLMLTKEQQEFENEFVNGYTEMQVGSRYVHLL